MSGENSGGHFAEVQFVAPAKGTPAADALAANAALKVSKVTKGLRKLRGLKTPKMKNLNLVKQVYKHTKQKRKKRHFSRNIKGKVIDGVSELYTLTAGMMLGIKCSIEFVLSKGHEEVLTVEDFSNVLNMTFPASGVSTGPYITPPHALVHTFKFKTYAPRVFGRIREFFGLGHAGYMDSVCGNYNYLEFISNSKSGQFFFYSHDGKYMIKTQTKEENKFMKRILPHYYKYITENPHTQLVRILAMHRIKMYHLRRKVHFVIMSSVFDTPEEIHTIFDLKGSLIGRSTSDKEKKEGGVLKDQDLLDMNKKFELASKKESFLAQLRLDANFLAGLNIMDYSLLVGIHDRTKRVMIDEEGDEGGNTTDLQHETTAGIGMGVVGDEANAGGNEYLQQRSGIGGSNTPFRRFSTVAASHNNSNANIDTSDIKLSMSGPEDHNGNTSNTAVSPSSASSGGRPKSAVVDMSATTPILRKRSNSHCGDLSGGLGGVEAHRRRAKNMIPCEGGEGGNRGRVRSSNALGGTDADSSLDGEEGEYTEGEYEEGEVEESDDDGYDSDEGDSELGDDVTGQDANDRIMRAISPPCPSIHPRVMSTPPPSLPVKEAIGVDKLLINEGTPPPANFLASSDSSGSLVGLGATLGRAETPYHDVTTGAATYGLGATHVHPWTARADGGINCRRKDGSRGDEIYYMGVIDILQQYNNSKKAENFFKGMIQDGSKISAVDAQTYAKRFIKFMEDNIV